MADFLANRFAVSISGFSTKFTFSLPSNSTSPNACSPFKSSGLTKSGHGGKKSAYIVQLKFKNPGLVALR